MALVRTTEKELAANRANAKNSTGPRTPEGKARTAQNACKHHLYARTYIIPPEWEARIIRQALAATRAFTADPDLRYLRARYLYLELWAVELETLARAPFALQHPLPKPLAAGAQNSTSTDLTRISHITSHIRATPYAAATGAPKNATSADLTRISHITHHIRTTPHQPQPSTTPAAHRVHDKKVPTSITLHVNGAPRSAPAPDGTTLLEFLRDHLHLTGAKYGCGEGACGACTVLIDGRPVQSCAISAASVQGRQITTIEGLAPHGKLHSVQQAFLDAEAFQCGYCTPAMILAAVALLKETPNPSAALIREKLEGHLCRCGTYPRIVEAVHLAAKLEAAHA